jgi:hypothetical protein
MNWEKGKKTRSGIKELGYSSVIVKLKDKGSLQRPKCPIFAFGPHPIIVSTCGEENIC